MPLGYVIAQVTVTDPEAFEKYRARVPEVTQGHGGEYLARGGRQQGLEGGEPAGNRTVLIRFESYERAVEWYHSNEYAELIKLRQAGSNGTLMVVEGVA
jgi:uncharacterized protein (DUF1330 family)